MKPKNPIKYSERYILKQVKVSVNVDYVAMELKCKRKCPSVSMILISLYKLHS